jgi:hypothetical protein
MLITIPEGWRPLDKRGLCPDSSPFEFSSFQKVIYSTSAVLELRCISAGQRAVAQLGERA